MPKRNIGNVNPYLINRSADYLSKSIKDTVTSFDTQMSNIEKSKNALALNEAEMKQMMSSIGADDKIDFKDELSKQIMAQIDNVHTLGYNSIGRDQTEYIKAQSNLLSGIKDLQEGLSILDLDAAKQKEYEINGQAPYKISRRTGEKARDFSRNIAVNNGNGTSVSYENGNFILSRDGFDLDISNYKKAREMGSSGLVQFVDDPSEEYKAVYSKYSKNYEPLISKIQEEVKKNGVMTTTTKEYEEANAILRSRLMKDPDLLTSVSDDEWQYLSQMPDNGIDVNEVFKGTPEQIQKAQEAKVNLIMNQYAGVTQKTAEDVKLEAQETEGQRRARLQRQKALDFEKMKFTVNQIQTAKTEDDLRKSVDFYLNRNLKHAGDVSKLAKGSKKRADMTAKLLNEAKGIDELGFKSVSGIVNNEGVFELDEDSNEFFIVDADNNLVDGIQDNVGLIDVLNENTVYDNLTKTQQGKIKPYVTDRMANFSSKINAIEKKQPVEEEADEEEVKAEDTTIPTGFNELNKYVDNTLKRKLKNINLQEYNKYRKEQGLEEVTQSDFDTKYKPTLITDATEIVVGGTAKDNISLIIYNEIDNYARKNKGKKSDPKSIL
jgi:hypothetical protein